MTEVDRWLDLYTSLIPDSGRFQASLTAAQTEWLRRGPPYGPEALGPLQIVGRLDFLLSYLPEESRRELRVKLRVYTGELERAVAETQEKFVEATTHALNYEIKVAEGVLAELKEWSIEEVRDRLSMGEVEDEFGGFVESAMFALGGLRLLGFDSQYAGFERKLARLREDWPGVAPKVVKAFPEELTPARVTWIKSVPEALWWDHALAVLIETGPPHK